jgi:[ribosomal protein S5]-alanine N-acetyltransferase
MMRRMTNLTAPTLAFAGLRLATQRLVLRPMVMSDAPALFAIHADPVVMRWWSTPPWASIDIAERRIADDLQAQHGNGDYIRLGLARREDEGTLVGQCTLFALNASSRRAEIGYSLAAAAWGQGLATEALRALIGHGFGAIELNRIEADIDPRNASSARVLERLGFVKEGRARQRWIVGGEVCDSDLYGLVREEWRGL